MQFQRVVCDNYGFCWTAVCAIAPEYEQFCVDKDAREYKLVIDMGEDVIDRGPTHLQMLIDRLREERGLEPLVQPAQPAPVGMQPENDDIPVDPPASAVDPKLKEREYYDWATHTTKYYSEEEFAILQEVSGGNVRGTSMAVGNINPVAHHGVNENEVNEMADMLQATTPLTPEEIAKRQAKIDAEIADLRKWSRNMKLKPEIWEKNRFAGNPHILDLPPPKTILVEGSHVWQDDRSIYIAHNHDRDLRKFVDFTRYSVKRGIKDGKLRYSMDKFIGGRDKGFIRQVKGHQHRVIYNTGTKCLYMFTLDEDRHEKVKNIRCVNFMESPTVGISGVLDGKLHDLFIKELLKIVRADVPDVVTWGDAQHESASFIVFQHRYNKAVKWVDRAMWSKICQGVSIKPFVVSTEVDAWGRPVPNSKENARGMRRFHKIFRKFTNYTGLVQALFQDGYKKAYLDLFARMNLAQLAEIHTNMRRNGCSQTLYNFMMERFKGEPIEFLRRIDKSRFKFTWAERSLPLEFASVTEDTKKYPHLVELWVKLCRRFIEENGAGMEWHIFRDTMVMAEQYHLRVRPNKFKSQDGVLALHDKLSGYRVRDVRAMTWYYHGSTIQPFEHPDKEYDGFRFVFLDTAQAIVDEGTAMHHCCGSYTEKCMSGSSLLFSMRKCERGYVTIELDGETLSISQKHTLGNNNIVNELVDKVITRWHEDILKLHANDELSYYQVAQKFNNEEKDREQKKRDEETAVALQAQMDGIAGLVGENY